MCFFGRESYGLRVFGIKTVESGWDPRQFDFRYLGPKIYVDWWSSITTNGKLKRLTNDTWVTHGPTTLVMSNDYSIVKVWGSISLSHTQVGVHPTSPKVDGFFWSTFGVRFNAESDELSGSIDAPCFNPCPFGWLKNRWYLSDIKINSDTIHWDVLNISSIHFWDPKVTMWHGLSYPETSGTIRFGTRCNC